MLVDAEALKLIWTALTFILPRPVTIDQNESGVCLRKGKVMKLKGSRVLAPGWCWVWPPIEKVQKIEVTWQYKDLRIQTIWGCSISGALGYTIKNAERALLQTYDFDDTIGKKALVAIAQHTVEHKDEQLDLGEISAAVFKALKGDAMTLWGIDLREVGITDITNARAIRHLGLESLNVVAEVSNDS